MKSRVLYEETYRKGQANIRKDLLPERLPYFAAGTTLVSMELRKAGRVEIDGEEQARGRVMNAIVCGRLTRSPSPANMAVERRSHGQAHR